MGIVLNNSSERLEQRSHRIVAAVPPTRLYDSQSCVRHALPRSLFATRFRSHRLHTQVSIIGSAIAGTSKGESVTVYIPPCPLPALPTAQNVYCHCFPPDLYITSCDSLYAPAEDPNAVVVIGQAPNSSLNAVETIMTGDMYWTDLYPWWATSAASAADQAIALSPEREFEAMSEMSIFTLDPAIPETPLNHGFYAGDTSPAALHAFMMQRASLEVLQGAVWPG